MKAEKGGPAKAEDVVRLYDSLMSAVKELSENAARLGGAAGEILLEECTAKARPACSPLEFIAHVGLTASLKRANSVF